MEIFAGDRLIACVTASFSLNCKHGWSPEFLLDQFSLSGLKDELIRSDTTFDDVVITACDSC